VAASHDTGLIALLGTVSDPFGPGFFFFSFTGEQTSVPDWFLFTVGFNFLVECRPHDFFSSLLGPYRGCG